jgi:hypothetical protein
LLLTLATKKYLVLFLIKHLVALNENKIIHRFASPDPPHFEQGTSQYMVTVSLRFPLQKQHVKTLASAPPALSLLLPLPPQKSHGGHESTSSWLCGGLGIVILPVPLQ